MKTIVVIPARWASTRFPGKPLALIEGKPMVQHVYERASLSVKVAKVVVATDHEGIAEVVNGFGGQAILTSVHHPSGTDRCYEAFQKLHDPTYEIVINVQGDEPFIHPSQIDRLIELLQHETAGIATLGVPISSEETLQNPNTVKVVVNQKGHALYFSRHPIPFQRNAETNLWVNRFPYLKHLGIYGFKAGVLASLTRLSPSPLELSESLEQLRWLDNGYQISVGVSEHESKGIDTPEDLEGLV